MAGKVIDPLNGALRASREIQAPEQVTEAPDRLGGYRVSSAAFKPGTDGSVSVDLEESLVRAGLPIDARYPALPRAVALVAKRVNDIVTQGGTVAHAPIPSNGHHGEIRMTALSRRQIRDVARNLADTCEVIKAIDPNEVHRLINARRTATGSL